MMKSDINKIQLNKFMNEFADGGAIRHLADQGFSTSQIVSKLDFPLPKAVVAQTVFDYYVAIGKILFDKPDETCEYIEKITYERVQGQYGRSSMQQVRQKIPVKGREYVECDFGLHMNRDYAGFIKRIEKYEVSDREYVLDMPWPRSMVYHELDDRMRRIVWADKA